MNGSFGGWAAGAFVAGTLAVCGCNRQSSVPFDPFLGPSRVAPPGTGTANGNAPYYPQQGPVTPGAPMPGTTTLPPGTVAPPTIPTVPNHLQGAATSTTTGQATNLAASATGASGVVPASHEEAATSGATAERSVVRIVEPATTTTATTSDTGLTKQLSDAPAALGEPRRLVLPEEPKEMTDLPEASDWTPVGGRSTTVQRPTATSVTASDASYGHDPSYGWLQGRLEYSETTQQYKLRYIPIDGTTDQYGGSVVLPKAPELAQYQHGQFVRVEGAMGAVDSETSGFAPLYHAQRIKAVTR